MIYSEENKGYYDFTTDSLVKHCTKGCLLPTESLANEYISEVLGDGYIVKAVDTNELDWTEESVQDTLGLHKRLTKDLANVLMNYRTILQEAFKGFAEKFDRYGLHFDEVERVLQEQYTSLTYHDSIDLHVLDLGSVEVVNRKFVAYELYGQVYAFPLRYLTDVGEEERKIFIENTVVTALDTLYMKTKLAFKDAELDKE